MKKLNKYKLDPGLCFAYIEENLNQTNELSSQILTELRYQTDGFYVLLPEDSDIERIHDFKDGYITSNVDKEISHLIVDKFRKKKCFFIFDDVNSIPTDHFDDDFLLSSLFSYKNEVYYVINQGIVSQDRFFKCLRISNAIWHSLCVVTLFDLNNMKTKKFDQDIINKICVNAQLVMISAYDGEGYVFWERTD